MREIKGQYQAFSISFLICGGAGRCPWSPRLYHILGPYQPVEPDTALTTTRQKCNKPVESQTWKILNVIKLKILSMNFLTMIQVSGVGGDGGGVGGIKRKFVQCVV